MSLPIGSQLGPYEIVAPLGAGGMGEVYKARDTKLNRKVAALVTPRASPATAPEVRAAWPRIAPENRSIQEFRGTACGAGVCVPSLWSTCGRTTCQPTG